MSKNIRGFSNSANLTINTLDIKDITVDNINATTGTFTGTVTFQGGVTMTGTFNIATLVSSGNITCNGDLTVNSSNEIYYKGQTLDARFHNESQGLVTIDTAQTITGAKTFSALASFTELTASTSIYGAQIQAGTGILLNRSEKFLVNGGESRFDGAITVANNNEINYKGQTLDARFHPTSQTFVTTDTTQTISGAKTFSNGLTVSSGTLTAETVTADYIRIEPLPSGNTTTQVPLVFCDTSDNNTLKQDTEPLRLSYKPSENKFFTGNAEINNQLAVLGDTTLTNNLTVSTGDVTVTAGDVTVTAGDLTVTNGRTFLKLDIVTSGDYGMALFNQSTNELVQESNPAQLLYNPGTNELKARNFIANVNVQGSYLRATQSMRSVLPTTDDDSEHYCFFQNPSGSNSQRFEMDADSSHFTYNPSHGRLTVYKLAVTNSMDLSSLSSISADVVGNLTGQVTLTAPNDTDDNDNFIPFIKGATNAGLLSSNAQLFFNPDNQTLRSTNITAATNITTPKLTMTANSNAEILLDSGKIFDYVGTPPDVYMGIRGSSTGIDFNVGCWNDGHLRLKGFTGSGIRFYVKPDASTSEAQIANFTYTNAVFYKPVVCLTLYPDAGLGNGEIKMISTLR